jgi:hypothetical protein
MAILRGPAAPQKLLTLVEDLFDEAAVGRRNLEDASPDEIGRNMVGQLVPTCTRLW